MHKKLSFSNFLKTISSIVIPISVLISCGSDPSNDISKLNIYGGTLVEEGNWINTVGISTKGKDFIHCTGTIVHPRLIITAKHCVENIDQGPLEEHEIYVGQGKEGGHVVPQYSSEKVETLKDTDYYRDVAYIVTKKEISIDPSDIIPILFDENEIKTILAPNAYSHIVGFGKYKDLNTSKQGRGIKYEASTSIDQIDPIISNGTEIKIGGNDKIKDSCGGDSGGPAFGKTKDGEWRVYGIVSRGGTCGHGGVWSLMHKSICEIERLSGIELDLENYCDKF